MAMVQFSAWSNCCNSCDFCLILDKERRSKPWMIQRLKNIRENINYIDWKDKFRDGISLLGGELYYIKDKEIQDEFLLLIDDIIEKIIKPSDNPDIKYSTVTNGMYDPEFLLKVMDKFANTVGIKYVDINFSYDLKYRFHNEESRKQCISNINLIHNRYDYRVGVQTITTQYFIDQVLNEKFDILEFEKNEIPGNILTLLYPHPINPQLPKLPDFNFSRISFMKFIPFLRNRVGEEHYANFYLSTLNSGTFKYTGIRDISGDNKQEPILSDGKEKLNSKCGHSVLYQCYTDSDKCMLCDLLEMGL